MMKVKVLIKLIFLLYFYLMLVNVNAQIMVPKLEWAKSSVSGFQNDGHAVGVDDDGNVYTAGLFRYTVDFDPGPAVYNLSSLGGKAVFISKYAANGDFIWAKHFSSPNGMLSIDMAVDGDGNVYTTGLFYNTVDFDPGIGVYNLTTPLQNARDIFISKLDSAGNFQWAKSVGGSELDDSDAITVDRFGNVYVTGRFGGVVDFDPGIGTFFLSTFIGSSTTDPFILKLDNGGDFVWAKAFTGDGYEYPQSIAVDSLGSVYSTGTFPGALDFDPGIDTSLLFGFNGLIYVSKLDSNGNFIWGKNMGGVNNNNSYDIVADSYSNIYIIGKFRDVADFDPGINTYVLNSPTSTSGFLTKLDSSGNFIWAKQTLRGISGWGNPYSVAVDADDNVYTTGYFSGQMDFDSGIDSILVQSHGRDIFILKHDSSGNFIWVRNIGSNGNDNANSLMLDTLGNIYIAGSAGGLIDFDPGYGVYNISAHPFVAKYSLCPESSGSMSVTSCLNYITPGGQNLTSTGIYRDVIYSSVGCDSIITLDLTIIPVDISVNNNSTGTISSNASGATYVWLDCSNNNFMNPILGETGQSLSPSVNGYYAVVVTQNGCTDTSNCYFESGINTPPPPNSIDDIDRNNGATIFPNPSDGLIKINLQKAYSDINLSLINVHGQVLLNKNYLDIEEIELSIEEPKGIYFIMIKSNSNIIVKLKVVKN